MKTVVCIVVALFFMTPLLHAQQSKKLVRALLEGHRGSDRKTHVVETCYFSYSDFVNQMVDIKNRDSDDENHWKWVGEEKALWHFQYEQNNCTSKALTIEANNKNHPDGKYYLYVYCRDNHRYYPSEAPVAEIDRLKDIDSLVFHAPKQAIAQLVIKKRKLQALIKKYETDIIALKQFSQ